MAKNKTGQIDCLLTHQQIAEIFAERGYPMTAKAAWHLEHRALAKIAEDPIIQSIAEDLGLKLTQNDR